MSKIKINSNVPIKNEIFRLWCICKKKRMQQLRKKESISCMIYNLRSWEGKKRHNFFQICHSFPILSLHGSELRWAKSVACAEKTPICSKLRWMTRAGSVSVITLYSHSKEAKVSRVLKLGVSFPQMIHFKQIIDSEVFKSHFEVNSIPTQKLVKWEWKTNLP